MQLPLSTIALCLFLGTLLVSATIPPSLTTAVGSASSCPLDGINPARFSAEQEFQGKKSAYDWYFSPCTPTVAPGRTGCPSPTQPGYFMQLETSGSGSCSVLFTADGVTTPWKKVESYSSTSAEKGGYSAQFQEVDGQQRRLVSITVLCDPSAGNLKLKGGSITVSVQGASQYLYSVEFLSSAVCSGSPPATTAPSSTATPSPPASSGFTVPLTIYPIYLELVGKWQLDPLLEISVGTPAQPIDVIFDTGSVYPVINNASCTMPACGLGKKYDTSASSTAKVNFTRRVTQAYGSGNNSGYPTNDVFTLFPTTTEGEEKTMTIDPQEQQVTFREQFLACDFADLKKGQTGLQSVPKYSGIFGMGPYTELGVVSNTTTRILTEQFDIGMAAVTMPRGSSGRKISREGVVSYSGTVHFGGYDQLLLDISSSNKEPVWAPIYPGEPFYVIEIQDILFNGKSTGVCSPTNKDGTKKTIKDQCKALLDTGSGILEFAAAGLPSSASSAATTTSDEGFVSDSSGSDNDNNVVFPHTIPCDEIKSLPTVGVVIEGTTFTLEPEDYILELPLGGEKSTHAGLCQTTIVVHSPRRTGGDGSFQLKQGLHHDHSSRLIYSSEDLMAVTNSGSQPAFLDLGIQWTSRVTTIFDWKNNRLGFIEHSSSSPSSPQLKDKGLSTGEIVGIVIGSLVGAMILLHIVIHTVVVVMKKKKKNEGDDMTKDTTEKDELLRSPAGVNSRREDNAV